MRKKKVEIFKHGSAYIPKKQDIISCPECGCTIDDYTETESDEWKHDYTVQIRTITRGANVLSVVVYSMIVKERYINLILI